MIAIVDDDKAVRTATASLLRSFGYETRVFASAEDFLAAGMDKTAACLITDVQMPGVGGMELQRILAARKCPIPVLFMTAYGNDAVRRRALDAGAIWLPGEALRRGYDSQASSGRVEVISASWL